MFLFESASHSLCQALADQSQEAGFRVVDARTFGGVNLLVDNAGGAMRLLARESASNAVRGNALVQGFIRTGMAEIHASKMYEHALTASALPRIGEVSKMADAAWYLASSNSSYLNGMIQRNDGGFLC